MTDEGETTGNGIDAVTIKPDSLFYFAKNAPSAETAGRVLMWICGRRGDIQLDDNERAFVAMITSDSLSFEKKSAEKRARRNEYQREYRARMAASRAVPMPQNAGPQNAGPRASGDGSAERQNAATPQNDKPPPPQPAKIDWGKIDTSDDGIFDGKQDPILLACKVCDENEGKAKTFWRRWVNKYGDGEFRDILFSFKREMEADERPRNPGAAFTKRLQKTGCKIDLEQAAKGDGEK